MAWDEWEQLKTAAAERTGTRLNQAPVPGGGSGPAAVGGLHHSGKPWQDAAGVADELRTSTNQTLEKLGTAHDGIAGAQGASGGTEGLDSLVVLRTVLASWEKRLEVVRDECASLGPALRRTASDLKGTDSGVRSQLNSVRVGNELKGW
ncbi:amino acid ABC transporter permease [Streptomyces sp. NPDC049906]|uniref:amino acid ABC transporter permease n=1 Tax=Streptomyces sp. NPDC049906 TaxID=3155656 RepID=UPI00341E4682